MKTLSAHIGYLFTELPLESRVAAAARVGFGAVEHPDPTSLAPELWRSLLADAGVGFSQMSSGTGGGGHKGLACIPGMEDRFLDMWCRALDFAETVGVPYVHPMAGIAEGIDAERARATYLNNIDNALKRTEGRRLDVLVEAISDQTVPGYYMSSLAQVQSKLTDHAQDVHILLDTYHAAMNGEDPVAFLKAGRFRVGHIHIADAPGRHEPGTGTIDFGALVESLHDIGFDGAIGFEYVPRTVTEEGLGWLEKWRNNR